MHPLETTKKQYSTSPSHGIGSHRGVGGDRHILRESTVATVCVSQSLSHSKCTFPSLHAAPSLYRSLSPSLSASCFQVDSLALFGSTAVLAQASWIGKFYIPRWACNGGRSWIFLVNITDYCDFCWRWGRVHTPPEIEPEQYNCEPCIDSTIQLQREGADLAELRPPWQPDGRARRANYIWRNYQQMQW